VRFFLFGSLRTLKRRARDVDLVVELEQGERPEDAMIAVAAVAPRLRKPVELWFSSNESVPNLAGTYDPRTERWAFWRRPGLPGFFHGLEPVSLDHVVRLAQAAGPYGPSRRAGSPGPSVECTIGRQGDGWGYELDGERHGPFPGPLEAASAAERAAKVRGELGPEQVLWFRLRP